MMYCYSNDTVICRVFSIWRLGVDENVVSDSS